MQPTVRRWATVVSASIGMPGDPGRQVDRGGDGLGRGRRADVRHAVGDRAAAVLDEQVRDPVGGVRREQRVDPALEALGRLGRQLVAPGAAEDRGGLEVRGLDDDVAGGLRQLGGPAAHHAGDADRAAVVGDQQVLGRQRAAYVVQGGQLLARGRPTHHDRAGQLVAVVAVDRLAELEHHVVGDVDGQRDRPHAGELDAPGDVPRGGRAGVEAGDGAGREDRAAVGVRRRGPGSRPRSEPAPPGAPGRGTARRRRWPPRARCRAGTGRRPGRG